MILFTRAIRSQYPHIPFAHSGTIGLAKGVAAYTPLVRTVINKEIIKKKIKEYLIFIIAFIMLNKEIYSDFFFSFISKFFTLGVYLFLLSAIFLLLFRNIYFLTFYNTTLYKKIVNGIGHMSAV